MSRPASRWDPNGAGDHKGRPYEPATNLAVHPRAAHLPLARQVRQTAPMQRGGAVTADIEYENLKVAKGGHIAVVTFNRPHKANALNHAHLADIEAAALSFRDDADTRVVIFTGEGRHFSSGADLDGGGPVAANLLERRRLARIGERATLAVYDMDQITIAAWNGAAMGGGAVLATAMDLRIGADDCFMQYPEKGDGLVPSRRRRDRR